MSYVPIVIEQTNRGERSYDIYSRLLKDTDRLSWMAKLTTTAPASIIAELLFLEARGPG